MVLPLRVIHDREEEKEEDDDHFWNFTFFHCYSNFTSALLLPLPHLLVSNTLFHLLFFFTFLLFPALLTAYSKLLLLTLYEPPVSARAA